MDNTLDSGSVASLQGNCYAIASRPVRPALDSLFWAGWFRADAGLSHTGQVTIVRV
jgi:hypothetical protein